jgi:hypothetical protein
MSFFFEKGPRFHACGHLAKKIVFRLLDRLHPNLLLRLRPSQTLGCFWIRAIATAREVNRSSLLNFTSANDSLFLNLAILMLWWAI